MVKLKPKICEGENPAKICDVSIPGRRNSQPVRPWGRDQPQEMIQQQGASVTNVCYSKCDGDIWGMLSRNVRCKAWAIEGVGGCGGPSGGPLPLKNGVL